MVDRDDGAHALLIEDDERGLQLLYLIMLRMGPPETTVQHHQAHSYGPSPSPPVSAVFSSAMILASFPQPSFPLAKIWGIP